MPINFQGAKNVQIENSSIHDIVGFNNIQCSPSHNVNCGNTNTNITTDSHNDSSLKNDYTGDDHSFPCSARASTPIEKSCDQDAYKQPAKNSVAFNRYTPCDPPVRHLGSGTSTEAASDRLVDYRLYAWACAPQLPQSSCGRAVQSNPFRDVSTPVKPQAAHAQHRFKANNPFLQMLDPRAFAFYLPSSRELPEWGRPAVSLDKTLGMQQGVYIRRLKDVQTCFI